MTQNNFRKEPTFGSPSDKTVVETQQTSETVDLETTKSANTPNVSLHSNQVPSYTFTPVMKRPANVEDSSKAVEAVQQEQAEAPVQTAENVVATEEQPAEPEAVIAKATPKTSGFAFSPVTEDAKQDKTEEKPAMKTNDMERVVPTANNASPVAKIPSKFRRLGLVAILLLVLLALFFWLKPNAPETVDELQSQQGGALPIEFRPVDEEEAKRAEAQAKAEQELLAQQQAQQAQAQQEVAPTTEAPVATSTTTSETALPASAENVVASNTANNAMPAPAVTQPVTTNVAPAVTKPVAPKPVVQPQVVKPKTQGSVIYQAETKKAEPKAKTVASNEVKKEKNAQLDQLVKNVSENKPAVKPAAQTASSNNVIVSSKTLTVPKSTSLMQVFRNNQLNISDVNAMNKVNNVISNLKVGERVTVRLDKNNRVVEMSIGSGGKFTRQANGSYSFK